MIIIIMYVLFSFLLDCLMSNYVGMSIGSFSYFRTIYSVISLVIIYNYFDNDNKYLKILIVLGFLFDIVYTNTLLINIFIFLIIYFMIKLLNEYIPNNLVTISIKSLIAISIYHILSYLILLLAHYDNYSYKLLLTELRSSIIMTIIYTLISYILISKVYFKKYDKKIK